MELWQIRKKLAWKDPWSESGLVLCLLAPDVSGLWEATVMMCVGAPLECSRRACVEIHVVIFMGMAPDHPGSLESFVV